MTEINPLNPLDYFDETKLSTTYDFNHDGKVDITDYNYAIKTLEDDDPNNDVNFTKAQLDNAFNDILKNAGNVETVTAANAATIGNEIKAAIDSGINNPANAKTLNELQIMGKNLTKYIRQCADVAKFLQAEMQELKSELDELDAKKNAEEVKYQANVQEVETKKEELATQMGAALRESQTLSEEGEARVRQITQTCVEEYKNGKHPNQNLGNLIESRLASSGGFNTARLRSILNDAKSIEYNINNLCSTLDTLTKSIRTITKTYNAENEKHEGIVTLRNDVLAAATTASEQYQSGYQKRIDMREAIVNKYKDTKVWYDRLNNFIDQGEMDNMPYADAWAILTTAFTDCGISYNKTTGGIDVPYGHDSVSQNVYSAFVKALQKNYGVTAGRTEDSGYEDEETPVSPIISRSDPMSFNVGDFEYSFINDNNNDGKFNDASEFLGATKGWEEMKAYDKDGDGIINGEELKRLNMVALDKKTGQYTFTTAAAAGITEINLATYQKVNQKEKNNDITVGTFSVVMNGQTIQARQSDDSSRNIANNYSTLFGSDIADLSDNYKGNPFMEEFVEKIDTSREVSSAAHSVTTTTDETERTVQNAKHRADTKMNNDIDDAIRDKEKADNEAKAEQKAAEAKQTQQDEQKKRKE